MAWNPAYISAPRRQQSGAQFKPLLGSGTRGAIHHDKGASSLWTTLQYTHNPTTKWKICCHTANKDVSKATWIFSSLCKAKTTCNWMQTGTRTRTLPSIPQFHEGLWRIRSHGTSELSRAEATMLRSSTSCRLQENKYHNKDWSCVRWKCLDFQRIVRKWHTTSRSYCATGFVLHRTAVYNPSSVLSQLT